MKKSRFTETQIVGILNEAEAGMKVKDLCRKHGISDATYYNWKAKYGGMSASELKRTKELESENAKLKRIYRVYCGLGLNKPRRTRRKLPERERKPLFVPEQLDQVWSADFMNDALYYGTRFRTLNVIDDYNREALAIEIDTSIRAPRVVRVLERLKEQRGVPDVIRVDNGPEFLSEAFTNWCQSNGVLIQYIQPGKPNQNAYIERFNRPYRNEVLNLYLFGSLHEVREITSRWIEEYNELRPHDALGGLPPSVYATRNAGNSTFELST